MTQEQDAHWSASKETKKLLNTLEQLEAMAGAGHQVSAEGSVRPSLADKVLAEENTRLKRANKQALSQLDGLISQISAKLEG